VDKIFYYWDKVDSVKTYLRHLQVNYRRVTKTRDLVVVIQYHTVLTPSTFLVKVDSI